MAVIRFVAETVNVKKLLLVGFFDKPVDQILNQESDKWTFVYIHYRLDEAHQFTQVAKEIYKFTAFPFQAYINKHSYGELKLIELHKALPGSNYMDNYTTAFPHQITIL